MGKDVPAAENRNDTDLLRAYARDGDEEAFAVLARRHVDMIFAVSLRRSDHRPLAEEATQNVLLSLSRKARELSTKGDHLTAWLHKSTRFEVAKLQRREDRLKKREQAWAKHDMKISARDSDETFAQWYPVLDQVIDRLRAPDREVIVRRYLEGQDFRRIGEALGVSEDTAQKRTSRAFDRLNRIFKRKIGMTVSSTALAAGLSQQIAEAAPAACLNVLGKTAAVTPATFFSTTAFTIMTTSKMTTVAAVLLAFGGGVAFFVNGDDLSPESDDPSSSRTAAADQTGTTDRSRDRRRSDTTTTASSPRDLEKVRLEDQAKPSTFVNPHPDQDELAERLADQHEELLQDLVGDLGLSEAQKGKVGEVLKGRLENFRAVLDEGPQGGEPEAESMEKEKAMLDKAGGIIRGAGLREELAGILTDDQLASFDEREAKIWQRQVDSHALTEFSNLRPVLELRDEQRDPAFQLLQASSAQILEADANARAFLTLQKGRLSSQMDLSHPADMEVLTEIFRKDSSLTPGSPAFTERVTEVVGGRIKRQVEELATVLDESQTERYRDYLVERSILKNLGIQLPTTDDQ